MGLHSMATTTMQPYLSFLELATFSPLDQHHSERMVSSAMGHDSSLPHLLAPDLFFSLFSRLHLYGRELTSSLQHEIRVIRLEWTKELARKTWTRRAWRFYWVGFENFGVSIELGSQGLVGFDRYKRVSQIRNVSQNKPIYDTFKPTRFW